MAGRADMLPDHGFIGAEPFINGVAQALVHVAGDHGASLPLGNVRIHHGDALEVLRRIPDGALSFAYLLHPDPWPKARHAKRRMMNDGRSEEHTSELQSLMRISYAVFCLKTKSQRINRTTTMTQACGPPVTIRH